MPLPLEVLADLQVVVDGEDIDVRGDGDRIIVDLSSLRAGQRVLASAPFAQSDRSTSRLNEALQIAGITVDVRVNGEPVARLGADATPNAIARLLNLGEVEVRPGRAARVIVRERPVVALTALAGIVALIAWLIARLRRD